MTYKQSLDDFIHITDVATNLSIRNTGVEVDSLKKVYGSWVFAKISAHAVSLLKIEKIPSDNNIYGIPNLVDLSSISSIARTIIDTFYIFFYLSIDNCYEFESKFRELLFEYHGEKQRLKMLINVNPQSTELKKLENEVEQLKNKIESCLYYRLLTNVKLKKNIRKGNMATLLNNTEITKRADIDPNYYKSQYNYFSTFIHSTGFSLSQLSQFKANDKESLNLIKTILEVCTGYMCCAVYYFTKMVPEINITLEPKTQELISIWRDILKNFSKRKEQ